MLWRVAKSSLAGVFLLLGRVYTYHDYLPVACLSRAGKLGLTREHCAVREHLVVCCRHTASRHTHWDITYPMLALISFDSFSI
jgi:hypothetical protein